MLWLWRFLLRAPLPSLLPLPDKDRAKSERCHAWVLNGSYLGSKTGFAETRRCDIGSHHCKMCQIFAETLGISRNLTIVQNFQLCLVVLQLLADAKSESPCGPACTNASGRTPPCSTLFAQRAVSHPDMSLRGLVCCPQFFWRPRRWRRELPLLAIVCQPGRAWLPARSASVQPART